MSNFFERLSNLLSKIVGENSNDTEKYHLGKLLHANLSRFPANVHQVDVVTGQKETNGSVLRRVNQFVKLMTKMGIKKGDVIGIIGPNNMDIFIPLFGAFVMGALVFPLDMTMGIEDFKNILQIGQPKVIFCQNTRIKIVKSAMSEINSDAFLYSFGETDEDKITTFHDFMKLDTAEIDFKIAELDPSKDGAVLICTSGSTGLPKGVVLTHKSLVVRPMHMWLHLSYPSTDVQIPAFSQLHWISSFFTLVPSMLLGTTRLQTEQPITADVVLKFVSGYNITSLLLGTPSALALTKHPDFDKTDFSKIKYFHLGGSDVPKELIQQIEQKLPNGYVINTYGMTETVGLIFKHDVIYKIDHFSIGKLIEDFEIKIVDVNTRQQLGPNQQGEALVRSDLMFKEYYNNPKATEEAYENGWFKTGDILYYNEDGHYYFVDRIKLMLKYLNHQISPQELEGTISMHPGVLAVGVTGLKVPGEGEYPVAFVIPKNGSYIKEDDVIKIVQDKLSPYKQLRGGVKFVESLPLTASGKIHRESLKIMAAEMNKNQKEKSIGVK